MPLPAPLNTFAGNPLDRASDLRVDPDWIAGRRADRTSKVAVFWKGSSLVQEAGGQTGLSYVPAPFAQDVAGAETQWVFLGLDADRAPVFAIDLTDATDPAVGGALQGLGRFANLRDLALLLPVSEAGVAATGRAVFEWGRRHRFCGVCGQPTEPREGGWKRICTACGQEHFPRTDPVVIMLPVQGSRCLLGRQAAWPAGRFSALAGFMEPGETIEEACAREVREEAGLDTVSVRYHSSQPWPFPTNLMIGLFAEVGEGEATPDQTELEAVRWFTRTEMMAVMAGEHEVLAPPPFAIAHHLMRAWAEGG